VIELSPSAVELIESGVHAHLATVNPDGTPQLSMVWSAVEDGEICVASLTPRRKLDNVRRNPAVAVSYESDARDGQQGLRYYLVVKGAARITEGGAAPFLRRIAARYVGPDVKFPRGDNPPEQGWIMRIEPQRILGYGPWTHGR
jgi:PPOX class probable F420-dependent enzyme